MDPSWYASLFRAESGKDCLVYKCCPTSDSVEHFEAWLDQSVSLHGHCAYNLVGAASSLPVGETHPGPSVEEAASLLHHSNQDSSASKPSVHFGCVAIAERHLAKNREHENMVRKIGWGAEWFVSQGIFDTEATIALLNDYGALCKARGIVPKKVLLTFVPCGRTKTMDFIRWLGMNVPADVEARIFSASSSSSTTAAAAAATTTKDTTQNEETKTTNEETKTTKKENHLTLCFLTINDILHEHIWRNWLTTTTTSNMTVSIVCHAKYPQSVKSEWLKRRLLVDRPKRGRGNELAEPKYRTYRPDWGSVEITRAMIELMKEGLRIGEEIDYHGRNEEERWLDREEEEDDRFSKRRYIVRNADGVVANDGDDDEENDAKVVLPKGTMPFQSQRFLFVSETCIPITTLAQVEKALFGDGDETTQNSHPLNGMNKSWLKARSTPNNGYARQKQWDCVRAQDVPSKHIWKADQWIVLTREHAMAVCRTLPHFINDQRRGGRRPPQQQELWEYFRQMTASDEIYFPTALSILGILKRPAPDTEVEEDDQFFVGPEVVRRRVTYCDWSTCAKNPASFGKKDIGDVYVQGRKEGCLIARKFGGVIRKQQGQSSSGGEDDENGLLTVEEWRKVVVKE
mmetsp:Transcript_12425/g.16579  ORF Transcript_12425/g.16579 Transcript_12425/m.16579 type:complete len:629 (+) Transcript_12425:268-2154(+)